MNTSALKQGAKAINRNSSPSVYIVAIIVCIVLIILNSLVSRLLLGDAVQELTTASASGSTEAVYSSIAENKPAAWETLLAVAVQLIMSIFGFGFTIFMMNTVRRDNPTYQNLLDGFGMPARIIICDFLMALYITLWSLLFIIPGFIAAYRYRQARYLLVDHPEWSPNECITQSKLMMNGHKWELFGLDLSFLGWRILAAFVPLVTIYTKPYFEATYILYYQRLAGIADEMDAIKSSFQEKFVK